VNSLVVILSLLGAAPTDPVSATAIDVLTCDFEEAADRDYDGWPDGWVRRHSRELPEFLKTEIVPEPKGMATAVGPNSAAASRTNHCLQIELNGGGAIVSSPVCTISPQFSLALSLRLKTEGLKYDGAWVELSLLDAEGNVLERRSSPPVTTCPDWQTIRLEPSAAVNNKAVRAVVTLHLQPLGKREDLKGRAWFDDLRIVRLPRMQLLATSPTGIYTKRENAELVCSVSGIRVRNPRVRFELFDQKGQRLAESSTALLSPQDAARWATRELPADGYAGQATWSPAFPDREPYGFYRIRASLLAEDSPEALLDRSQSIAVLRPLPPPRNSEFGWTLPGGEDPLPFGPLAMLLGQAGLGWTKMPVWYDPTETGKADRIAWFAEQLSIQGIELVGVLDQPPPDLRAVFREQGRLPVASVFAEPELWQPAVGPIMTRLSLKVHWWQLGQDNDVSFIGYPQLETKIAEIKRNLEQYGQQINLGLNWRWVYAIPRPAGDRLPPWAYFSYSADPPLTAEEIGAYLAAPSQSETVRAGRRGGSPPPRQQLVTATKATPRNSKATSSRQPSGLRRWMLVWPLPRADYSADVRLQDLVQRMLAAKINGAHAVFLPQPFDEDQGIMNSDGSPGELFVPWRTTAMLIGGTEYLGPLQLPGGTTGHVFARDGRAVMAVWSDRPAIERVFLGDEVEQIDVWGRATKPVLREQDGRSLHELHIGTLPTFITGLSEAVARWQAALAFENPRLSSVAGREQIVMLRLRNTFPQGINGELTLNAPKSWGIDPRPTRFKIAEGEELMLPLPVTLMADANSGPQPVRLDFDVAGYHFSVHRTLQLGLDDVQVEMTSSLRKDPKSDPPRSDLRVELHLTNLSERPLSFQCVLFAPGRRRETRQVVNLGHDRHTITFVLPDGEQLIGKKLWLRAEEIGGSRVLNYTLAAER
jgi:hypothetical protein